MLNSTGAYYKASIKTQIKHKNNINALKQNTKQTKTIIITTLLLLMVKVI